MKQHFRLIIFFCLLVLIDQLLKFILRGSSVCNKNIAWSLSIAPGFFYFLWIIIFVSLIFLLFRSRQYFDKIFIALILSGAVSNIIDRFTRGCVVDFIDLKFWPAFNFADIYITAGVAMLVISISKKKIVVGN